MQELFAGIDLGLNHVQVIVQGMMGVARCDGVHQTEQVLVKQFYEACRTDAGGLADFEDLARTPFNAESARDVLDSDALRQVFLKSCVLLAHADGKYTEAERKQVSQYASLLKVEPTALQTIEEEVSGILLRQISRIQNLDALRSVASELQES
jgi:hypothetical protein